MGSDDLLSLSLPADPESVAVARQAVARRAEQIGFGEPTVGDLKTVVSEACGNVVRHAYAGADEPGPLEVEMSRQDDTLQVIVRDQGCGMRPRPDGARSGLRMGLLLIGALSSCFQLASARERGTKLTIRLPLPRAA
jgi:anti-sigma regulatory factor (Ser/Thr protein kinase)